MKTLHVIIFCLTILASVAMCCKTWYEVELLDVQAVIAQVQAGCDE